MKSISNLSTALIIAAAIVLIGNVLNIGLSTVAAAKIIVSVVFGFFYWFCCFLGTGTDQKNLAGLRSYPDEVIAMSIQEKVDIFVDEILEVYLRRLRAEDEEFQDTERYLVRLSEKVMEHLNTLSDSQRKALTDYSDTRNSQESTSYHYLYLAGLKDGIRILKFLEVL